MIRLQNFINGELLAPVKGQYIDNYEPATGKVYGEIPNSTEEDVELAVVAAEKAFPIWSFAWPMRCKARPFFIC